MAPLGRRRKLSSTLARRLPSSSLSRPPAKAAGLVQRWMPVGYGLIRAMRPVATFPAAPASTARAGMSTLSSPAFRTPSSVVSKASPLRVRHTLPAGMARSVVAAWLTEKRSTPSARSAPRRVMPRISAWRSSISPSAVWGKLCRATHSAWTSRA